MPALLIGYWSRKQRSIISTHLVSFDHALVPATHSQASRSGQKPFSIKTVNTRKVSLMERSVNLKCHLHTQSHDRCVTPRTLSRNRSRTQKRPRTVPNSHSMPGPDSQNLQRPEPETSRLNIQSNMFVPSPDLKPRAAFIATGTYIQLAARRQAFFPLSFALMCSILSFLARSISHTRLHFPQYYEATR